MTVGCTLTGGETVPKEDYDSVVRAYEELRISSEQTRMDFAEQASAVDGILQELSEISGRTASLRTDVEQGTARLTQVEMIEDNIDEIKLKLEELDRLSRDNAAYRKVVANLKNVITEKEREIEGLRKEIEMKDRTISEQFQTITEQHGTIQSQSETISSQQEDIRHAVQEQARMLFQAGLDFEELGDQSPTVSRRKDRAKVKSLTLEMYEKALLYYTKAEETGFPDASAKVTGIREKIAALNS